MTQRELLIDGALKCLQERGYARTTARDIVAAAPGTHLAQIGYHFGSKEQLLNEALTLGFQRWVLTLVGSAFRNSDASPAERLRRMVLEMSSSFEENRTLAVAFLEALAQAERSEAVRRELANSYMQARPAVADMIEAALPEAKHESLDRIAVASVVIAAFEGLLIQWLVDPGETPLGERLLGAIERAFEVLAPGDQASTRLATAEPGPPGEK